MKTKYYLTAIVALLLLNCQNAISQINYGLHAGLNVETQAELGLLWDNADLYQGFTIGGMLEYGISDAFSLQTEVNYAKKGEKVETWPNEQKTILRREFNYVTVPLLAKFNFKDADAGENWKFSLFTGPYAGFLTSAYANLKADDNTTYLNIKDQTEDNDWGVIIGGGISKRLTNGSSVTGELRYDMGLSKIDRENPDLRNKGIGLVIGYMF